jgi:hypothetical protein
MDIRIFLSTFLVVGFLCGYTYLLWYSTNFTITNESDLIMFIMKLNAIKMILFGLFFSLNSLLIFSCKSVLEREILTTGIFSIIFITLISALHYSGIYSMPTIWNMVLFNVLSVTFFLIVYLNGKKHKIFNGKH